MNEATIKLSQNMQGIAQGLDDVIRDIAREQIGFALVVFTEGRASCVSNCDRAEIVQQLKDLLDIWDQGMPDIPAHKLSG